MEQGEFLECTCPNHKGNGSIHPKDHVPKELFTKKNSIKYYKFCIDCRVKQRKASKKSRDKRKANHVITGDVYKCLECNTDRTKEFCQKCADQGDKGSEVQRQMLAKIKIERILKMGCCCNICKKIFLKKEGGGLIIVESLENVEMDNLELFNLEWDHLTYEEQMAEFGQFYGEKRKTLGNYKSYDSMIFESRKCQLLCILCHKIKTNATTTHALRESDPYHKTKYMYVQELKRKIGKCEVCSLLVNGNNLFYFEFDHIDQTVKIDNVSAIMASRAKLDSIELINEEVAKCRLLCSYCHRIHSINQNREKNSLVRATKKQKHLQIIESQK